VAHRGASGQFPENTLLAFSQALAQGADALELDVGLTADRIPVVLHDRTLDRTTNGTGPLAGISFNKLRTLDAGRGETVPTLSEVLDRFPGTPLILEIKEARASAAIKEVLTRHGAEGRVLIGGFEHSAIAPFGTGWLRSASRREVALFWVAARMGMRAAVGAYAAFTVPEHQGRLTVVDRKFMLLAARMRKPVHVWTVNDMTQAGRLRALGVCGLITNFPARMREIP